MKKCTFDKNKQEDILYEIEDFISKSSKLTINDLNTFVSTKLSISDFDINVYYENKIFKQNYHNLLIDYGLDEEEELIPSSQSGLSIKSKNRINVEFTTNNIDDMFHSLPTAREIFNKDTKAMIINSIFLGNDKDTTFVTDDKVNENLNSLKNDLFIQIQKFLISKKILPHDSKPKNLYDKAFINVDDYGYYKIVMNHLKNYFFTDGGAFSLMNSFKASKLLPNIENSQSDIIKAYNAGIFLSNFDTILHLNFRELIKVDYSSFNTLQATSKIKKYERKVEGIKNPYWVKDNHEAEGSESYESEFTKLLVSTIPMYNKKGVKVDSYMTMADFYLIAGKLAAYEIEYGNIIKATNPNSKFLYEAPAEVLEYYLKEIIDENSSSKELRTAFSDISDKIISLEKFLKTNNLKVKENNSEYSIRNIFGQIFLNNFGASYTKYNSNGIKKDQEMFNQNFANVKTQELVYNKFLRTPEFKTEELKQAKIKVFDKALAKIFTGVETNTNVGIQNLRVLSKLIEDLIGIKLDPTLVLEALNGYVKVTLNGKFSVNGIKNGFINLLINSLKDHETVLAAVKAGTVRAKAVKGDNSIAEYVPNVISNPLYIEISKAYLNNYPLVVVMNAEMSSGEKLPSFKLANLTYKDMVILNQQRKKQHENSIFKSLLITSQKVILKTGTKLEAINGKENKHAAKFNVAENFISDFQFGFLNGLAEKTPNFSLMIGNYADKGTILTKVINANFKNDDEVLLKQSPEKIIELVKKQGFNYYKMTLKQVISDYNKLLNLNLNDEINDNNIKIINEALSKIKITDLSYKASKLNINLTVDLHYSKYSNGIRLNQFLIDNYKIFSSDTLFAELIKHTEDSFINKHIKFNADYPNDLGLLSGIITTDKDGNSILSKALESLNLTKKDISVTEINLDLEEVTTYPIQIKNELNPILKKWLWASALFRNEYLFVTGKGEYMHPHKNNELSSERVFIDPDILSKKDKKSVDNSSQWESFFTEMDGRLSSMGKRNVIYTATMDMPIKESSIGVPLHVNMAVIEDFKDHLYNIKGDTNNQEVHDGSSYINYVYSKMIENSYQSKDYSGTKKQFATFITDSGVTIKKDAESVINNDRIRKSARSSISFLNMQKKMFDVNVSVLQVEGSDPKKLNEIYKSDKVYYYESVEGLVKINGFSIERNNTIKLKTSVKKDGIWSPISVKTKNFNTLFDLWNIFGAQYSTNDNGNFNEGSNEAVYEIITKIKDTSGKYFLKDNMIHIISNASSIKAGGVNINPVAVLKNNNPLAYYTFENQYMGPQLDAGHDMDESKIKEITQVISALAQSPTTSHLAKEAYDAISQVIDSSIQKYQKYFTDFTPENKNRLREMISKEFVKTVDKSKGETLAKILIHNLGSDGIIPFSNQNFFVAFVRDIITRMNNDFISRYYAGTGAILIPSHGIIQVYDIPKYDEVGNITGYNIMTQSDLIEEALKTYKEDSSKFLNLNGKLPQTIDDIVDSYLNTKLASINVTMDKVQLGDTVEIIEEIEDYNWMEHGDIADDINVEKKTKAWRNDPTKINETYEFSFVDKPKEIFELVKDLEPNQYSIHFKTTWDEKEKKGVLSKDEISRLIGNIYSFLPPNARISTWSDKEHNITRGGRKGLERFLDEGMVESGETRTNWFEGKPIELPVYKFPTKLISKNITLSDPDLYYKFKEEKFQWTGKKVLNVARDLKPSITTFNLDGFMNNTFDMQSVKLRFKLNEFTKLNKLINSNSYNQEDLDNWKQLINSENFKLLEKFFWYINPNSNVQNITFLDILTKSKESVVLLEKGLLNWAKRQHELLDKDLIISSFNINDDLKNVFMNDNFNESFKDALPKLLKSKYIKSVTNVKTDEAELILGDIYQSKFNRDSNDSMYLIKEQGISYFENKLIPLYDKDDYEADCKLITANNQNVYIKFVNDEEMPAQQRGILKYVEDIDSEKEGGKYVYYDELGNELFSKNDDNIVVNLDKEGNIVVYIKSITKNNLVFDGKVDPIEKADALNIGFGGMLKTFLDSFNGNINSFIPLMNITSSNNKITKSSKKEDSKKIITSINDIVLKEFIKFSGYIKLNTSPANKEWLNNNKGSIVKQLSSKMYASWEKSHEFIAARIPAQSMQSFMPMKNIAYNYTTGNDAYVSVWQIWLQGSDFDIDKAYMLGNGFTNQGNLEITSDISSYSSSEQLNALQALPMPSGTKIIFNEKGIDFNDLYTKFLNSLNGKIIDIELPVETINVINEALKRINKIKNKLDKDGINLEVIPIKISLVAADQNQPLTFINLINQHNKYTNHLSSKHAVKNSVVDKIRKIITTPSNQIWATTPVDVKVWHDAVSEVYKSRGGYNKDKLNSYDIMSFYKQQYDAAVGKDDVGIAANGLKVFFGLTSYYNDYYDSLVAISENDPKLFNKVFTINGVTYDIAAISDVDITTSQKSMINKKLKKTANFLRSEAALYLSSFTSAATDNAKELLMAKVNANVELASMHIYLMVLGLTPVQIVDIMTSPAAELVVNKLQTNIFYSDKISIPGVVIDDLIKNTDDKQLLSDLIGFKQIFNGAQEIKSLAKLLGVNQKTSANIEEIHKYFSTFETALYGREFSVFGREKLLDLKKWINTKDSDNIEKASKANEHLGKIIAVLKEKNPTLNEVTIKDILKRASEVTVSYINEYGVRVEDEKSILCGQFDYRYYIDKDPTNDEYRKITVEYYNLIKDTFNIFDITQKIPHIAKMIDGVVIAHQILLTNSVKYNYVFNVLKEYSRTYNYLLSADENVKNILGIEVFPTKLTEDNIKRAMVGLDMRIKSMWLKDLESKNKNISFNLEDIFKIVKDIKALKDPGFYPNLESITNFKMYTSDEGRLLSNVPSSSTEISLGSTNETIISLNSAYGVANFKKLMEEVLLPILQTKSGVLTDSLRISNSYSLLGLPGTAITSTFGLSSLNNAVSIDKFQKLVKEFNDLDYNKNTKGLIKDANGKPLKWRDLFYLYNLLVNNEKYGDLRLTPLMQDYIKEQDSLGFDYISFFKKLDTGEINLLTADSNLQNNLEYDKLLNDLNTLTEKLQTATKSEKTNLNKEIKVLNEQISVIKDTAQMEFVNDILFYGYNTKGSLKVGYNKTLQSDNSDFVMVVDLTETAEQKKNNSEFGELLQLLYSNKFLIKFKC